MMEVGRDQFLEMVRAAKSVYIAVLYNSYGATMYLPLTKAQARQFGRELEDRETVYAALYVEPLGERDVLYIGPERCPR